NIDATAFIYRNVQPQDDAHHWLQVRLVGDSLNRRGIGAELMVVTRGGGGGQRQYVYNNPYRGYMSTMDDRAHFGLGRATRVDTLEVTWPDGRYQLLTGLDVDRMVTVRQRDGMRDARCGMRGLRSCNPSRIPHPASRLFEPMDARRTLKYEQPAATAADYSVQPLLPYQPSSQGPPVAVGDVNGDGLDDVFIGGAAGVPGKLFVQGKDGSFVESTHG